MVARGELRLPEMQRQYVWPATRVRDLLDSLYRGYPSGSILVWETEEELPTRDLAVTQAANAFATHKLLLDGQQRLTSLSAVLNGEPVFVRGRKRPIEILFNLDHPDAPVTELADADESESPALAPAEDEPEEDADTSDPDLRDRLNRRTFVVGSRQLLANPSWIRVSDVFAGRKTDWQLIEPLGAVPPDPRFEKYMNRLQRLRQVREYPYVMQVLGRNLSYEEVTEIFVRVNSLGVKLRGSDLALAQITARWRGSLDRFERFAADLEEHTGFSVDVGLLVRAMVAFATGQSRFKTLPNVSVERMKEGWDAAQDGLRFAVNFLRSNCGIEDESLLGSPLILLAVAVYAMKRQQQLDRSDEQALRQWVLVAGARGHYGRGSTETILDQDLATIRRGQSAEDLLRFVERQVGRLYVEADDLARRSTNNPLFSMAYLALKEMGARDWLSNLGLSLSHQGKIHFIEYHHIFPKSVLTRYGYEPALINEIANLAFVSGKANRLIFTRPPSEYLPDVIADNGDDALMSHCIPLDPELWAVERFPEFLEWRRERLADEINNLMGTPVPT